MRPKSPLQKLKKSKKKKSSMMLKSLTASVGVKMIDGQHCFEILRTNISQKFNFMSIKEIHFIKLGTIQTTSHTKVIMKKSKLNDQNLMLGRTHSSIGLQRFQDQQCIQVKHYLSILIPKKKLQL